MTLIPDQQARQQALDPSRSFLVQAPAGSGKTELLTQRLLVLLAVAEKAPEEIVAITFTRKAAAEMRARLITALLNARQQPEPQAAHAKQTWRLAKQVLQRDGELQWRLLDNPQRLRITTIDSLCAGITQAMPLTSQFGGMPQVTEDAKAMYGQAVDLLLADLDSDQPWQAALATLLQHIDNRFDIVSVLLTGMLAPRDQWLDVVQDAKRHDALRPVLEQAFQNVTDVYLQRITTHFPAAQRDVLTDLLASMEHPIQLTPQAGIPFWQAAAAMLLTNADAFRKSVDKRCGFPDPKKAPTPELKQHWQQRKEAMKQLLADLSEVPGLQQVLADCRYVPEPCFPSQQWQVLQALLTVLPVLVGYLKVVFQQSAQVDFTEVALSALHALGDDEQPSDLALVLDYRIRHLLVDEFQDTSLQQFRLLEKLTRGWQAGDGRTLFCVGDPMQSIYRFRQADVSLFLHAKQAGIGGMALQFLRLQANFRSQPAVIDWVNRVFPAVFPPEDDVVNGAVGYSPSVAMREGDGDVVWRFEPQAVLDVIQACRAANPDETIAILVRSRNHLAAVLPLLQQADIPYQAVDIETLAERQLVQDLLSLTFALSQTADTLSWLAILRAPWAGLDLKDLTRLVQYDVEGVASIWERLHNSALIATLSETGQQIVARIVPILQAALARQAGLGLSENVYQTWLDLQGPACITEAQDAANAESYFDLLRDTVKQGRLPNRDTLLQRLAGLKAKVATAATNPVQVMTIHKSKGLEFDTVILPGLEKRSRPTEPPLLLWEPYRLPDGDQDILMAPIHARADQVDPMYQFLRQREQEKERFELQRLLYVAVTRAKQRLALCTDIAWDEKKDQPKLPQQSSLLGLLWHDVDSDSLNRPAGGSLAVRQAALQHRLLRLQPGVGKILHFVQDDKTGDVQDDRLDDVQDDSAGGILNNTHPVILSGSEESLSATALNRPEIPTFGTDTAALVGNVIHAYLARFSQNPDYWQTQDVTGLTPNIRSALQAQGVRDEAALALGVQKVLQALRNVFADEAGRWILAPQQDALSEFAVSRWLSHSDMMSPQQLQASVLDRTFIDNDGVRWIIDYKTAEPLAGESIDAFVVRETALYQSQLQRYADVCRQWQPDREIRCGLYFVMLPRFVSVPLHCGERLENEYHAP